MDLRAIRQLSRRADEVGFVSASVLTELSEASFGGRVA